MLMWPVSLPTAFLAEKRPRQRCAILVGLFLFLAGGLGPWVFLACRRVSPAEGCWGHGCVWPVGVFPVCLAFRATFSGNISLSSAAGRASISPLCLAFRGRFSGNVSLSGGSG